MKHRRIINRSTSVAPVSTPTLSAAVISSSEIDLTWHWSGSVAFQSMTLQRATAGPGGPWTTIATSLTPSPAVFADTGRSASTQYWYQVFMTAFAVGNSAAAAATGTTTGGGGAVTKFNPGWYPVSDAKSNAGQVAFEVPILAASGPGGSWVLGNPYMGYSANYDWGYLEPNGGDYATGVAIVANDFNKLQASCPGAHFILQIEYATYPPGNFTPTNGLPWIPNDILNNVGTYGAGPTGSSNSGWALSGYNGSGPNNFAVKAAAIWRTAVMNRWILFLNILFNTSFTTTAGPYAGQVFTFNTHPLFEGLIDLTEYSWSFGPYDGNPIPPADYSDAQLTSALLEELLQVKIALSQTQFAMMLSYGDSGPNAYVNLNTLVQYSANNHCSISNADTFQDVTQINGEAFYTGNPNGTGVSPTPDNRGKMGFLGCSQPLDYDGGSGSPPGSLGVMYFVWNTQLKCTHILPQMWDEVTGSGVATFMPNILNPFARANPIPNTTRPTNLP